MNTTDRRSVASPMKRALALVLIGLSLWCLSVLQGCATSLPKIPPSPKVVTVTVHDYKPLPCWATYTEGDAPCALPNGLPFVRIKPIPADGTPGGLWISHEARGEVIDLDTCIRRLLRKLDAIDNGLAPSPATCEKDSTP